jgi:filamentous hemagglutinin
MNHQNGAIAEAHGYNQALQNGEIGIQEPGKVTAPGPDYITFDPKTQTINIYDSKYSSTGKWPNSAKGFGSQAWLDETQKAINNISNSTLKQQVQNAFNNGNISWQIFKWPQ